MSPPNGPRPATAAASLAEALRLARELDGLLKPSGLWLATAESCTGGLIASLITAVPGCGDWYLGGAVSYAETVKTELLGVSPIDLRAYGAVSRPVALAMAEGVLDRLEADLGVSVTGFAGPDGGTAEEPVGSVWIGLARRGHGAEARRFVFGGDREAVRSAAAAAALGWVVEVGRGRDVA